MKRSPRTWRRRLLFAALLVTMLWLLLEAAAWLAYGLLRGEPFSYARVHGAQARLARQTDVPAAAAPELAFQDSGGDTCIHPWLGFVANRDTDDQMLLPAQGYGVTRFGFVDDGDPVQRRRGDTVLVGIFGGSVAQFFGEIGADELARRLRAHGAFAGKRIEFVRLGLGGFKQPQQLFALTWLLSLGGELDVAVNIDGFNEATLGPLENVPRGVAADFPRNWSLLAEHAPDPHERRLMGTVAVLQNMRRGLAESFSGGIWRWSVAANLVWESTDRWLERAAGERLLALQQSKRTDLPFHVTGPGAATDAAPEALAADAVATWTRCTRTMHAICAAHGIRYFHFLQPNQYDADSKPLTEAELRDAYDPQSRYLPWVRRTYPELRAAGERLAAEGIAFTDLSGLFRDVAGTVYIDNCCHVNAEGNKRLAQAIAARIVAGAAEAAPAEPLHGLRFAPAALRIARPLARVDLRLLGRRGAGGEEEVTYANEVTFTSSTPGVAHVDRYGVVTAIGSGTARIVARAGDATAEAEVVVEPPPNTDLGGAFAPPPLRTPVLHAHSEADGVVLSVTPPGPDLPGAVTFAVDPAPRAFCGGRVFVPLSGAHATPLAASAGVVRVPFVPPDPDRRTVYVQAIWRVGGDVCGFAVSNAVAISR